MQKHYRTSEKHSKHVFWGLTKNAEKHFYHLGYRGWPKNTQKHVFWGLTKNTEKHFYHLGLQVTKCIVNIVYDL
jgi:hypothetical protein